MTTQRSLFDQGSADIAPGGWVAGSAGPTVAGFWPPIARVVRVGWVEGELVLDLVLYAFDGVRIGRQSPAADGLRGYETRCTADAWEPIAPPEFERLAAHRYSYGYHLNWRRAHPQYLAHAETRHPERNDLPATEQARRELTPVAHETN